MKKKYVNPCTEVCDFVEPAQMVCSSLRASTGETTDIVMSNRRGWNSADWSAADEEEE